MERKYFKDIGYKPFLFYIVFGVSGEDLEVSREKHKVDELPEDSISEYSLEKLMESGLMDGSPVHMDLY